MKPTCMLIAVLFLTACPLIIGDLSEGKQEYRAVRLRDLMRNSKGSRSRTCRKEGEACPSYVRCCPDLKCCGFKGGSCFKRDPGC
uniref:Ctr_23_T conopeptide n=1 Tax=Conus tribblei TaxID=101761 RepID=A0A0C9SEM1_CONTD